MIILFLFLLLIPINTYASAYITDFQVQNGQLSLPFQKENNLYTIYLEKGETKVDFTYQLEEEDAIVKVFENMDPSGEENELIMEVTKNEEKQTYTFYVEKEEETPVFQEWEEQPKPQRSPYLMPCIIISSALCILTLFYLLIIRGYPNAKKGKL